MRAPLTLAATALALALPAIAQAAPRPILQLAQATQPSAEAPQAPAPATPTQAAPAAPSRISEQDLTALRYYVQIKDWNRVEAEIRRLRGIDPNWQPPADLMSGQTAGPSVNEQELWDLFGAGRYADVRARIAQLQQANPSYTPSADLLRQLDLAEGQQRLKGSSETAQWQAVVDEARRQPELLNCSRTDVVWRTAEAFAHLQQTGSAFDLYRSLVSTCADQKERIATLQKANAFLSADQMAQLYALARERAGGDTAAIDQVQKSLEAGRRAAQQSATPRRGGSAGPGRAAGAQDAAANAAKESGAFADCLRLTNNASTPGMKLTRGWCLYGLDRPTEASLLFAAVRSQSRASNEVQDAAYGQILATLRRGLVDDAQTMIDGATLTGKQHRELQAEVLAQLAIAAHDRGDDREALRLLDTRDQDGGGPARRDLQLMRGFALYNQHRFREALEVFTAVDRVLSTPDSREGLRITRDGLYGYTK